MVAGLGLGLYYSRRLYRRVDFLRRTAGVMESLSHRLSYAARPMGELWQAMAAGQAFADFSLVRDTAAAVNDMPFGEAFAAAVDKATADGLLTAEGYRLLTEFGEGCGRFDLAGQIAHVEAYRRLLSAAAEEARGQATAKGQVYQMLGVAGGVGMALLLI